MKIIQKGKITKPTKRFTCHYCSTIFEAELGEYQNADQIEAMHDGIIAKCKCPICGQMVYIDKVIY